MNGTEIISSKCWIFIAVIACIEQYCRSAIACIEQCCRSVCAACCLVECSPYFPKAALLGNVCAIAKLHLPFPLRSCICPFHWEAALALSMEKLHLPFPFPMGLPTFVGPCTTYTRIHVCCKNVWMRVYRSHEPINTQNCVFSSPVLATSSSPTCTSRSLVLKDLCSSSPIPWFGQNMLW